MPREAPYLQVADDLRARIQAGEWAVGEKLPGRSVLADDYQVGANVIQRATERLIIEGVLEGRAGSGTFVRSPRDRLRMVRSSPRERVDGSPFRTDMREQGRLGTWESHSAVRCPAPKHVAVRLGIDEGDLCVRTDYEFFADSMPVQLSVSWEPMAITDGTPILLPESGPLAGRGVVERMRSIGITIAYAFEVPRPSRATQEQANLLGISLGELLTIIERTYYDSDDRPIETADVVVPDVRWEIAYEVTINQEQRDGTDR